MRLFDLDEAFELKETKEDAAEEDDVEHAEGDVENGCDRRAREAFSCFLFSMTLDDGDRVGEIGADDDDWAVSSGLPSSSVPTLGCVCLELLLCGL